jgi:lysophospholipase L1-like esterase
MRARLTRAARATALVVLGLVFGLAATELCLETAAGVRAALGRRLPSLVAGTGSTILCVGDSNTYGFNVDPDQSYPSQLERRLNGAARVINLGFPGVNSSQLQARLPRMLAATQPDIVFALVGVTDLWTLPLAADSPDEAPTVAAWLWERSRLFRLLYMVWRGSTLVVPRLPAGVDEHQGFETTARYGPDAFALGWQVALQPDWARVFAEHVLAMRSAAGVRGVRFVLLTYASDLPFYRYPNKVIRQTAADLEVPLIDIGAQVRSRCAEVPCDDLFFPDGHPTAAGYTQMAAMVAAWLADNGGPAPPAS